MLADQGWGVRIMTKARELRVPFNSKTGEPATYDRPAACGDVYRPNFIWTGTLTYTGFERGRSRLQIEFAVSSEEVTFKKVNMSMTDFDELLRGGYGSCDNRHSQLTFFTSWTWKKAGSSYLVTSAT